MKLTLPTCLIMALYANLVVGSSGGYCPVHRNADGATNIKKNVYDVPTSKPSFFQLVEQRLQIHNIQHPNGILAKSIGRIIHSVQSVAAAPTLPKKRQVFGQNFCHAGQIVLSEWDEVEHILTKTPQARTFQLGPNPLEPKRFPMMVTGKGDDGRPKKNLFLLALSSKTGKTDEMHEAAYNVFVEYIMMGAPTRQNDPIAKALVEELVEDYKNMPHGEEGEFFTDTKRGLPRFMIKYLHYTMFGISPSDDETIDALFNFFYGNKASTAAMYYFKGVGKIFNLLERRAFNKQLPIIAKIYEESPSLAAMPDSVTSFNLSRHEVAHIVIPILSIAGTVGPRHILRFAMGYGKFTKHIEGVDTDKIDVTKIWDNLNLDDKAEVEKFIYEVSRIQTPVSASHHVATKEFTVKLLGKDRIFPKGTQIAIPIKLAMLDENMWKNAHDFDMNRPNLVEKSMIFHSVGNETNGRLCPGKFLTMHMVTEILVRCGKARRE